MASSLRAKGAIARAKGAENGRRDPSASLTPIVFLHGATASAKAWQPVPPLLASPHPIVTPTFAGHGGVTARQGVVSCIVDDPCCHFDDGESNAGPRP